MLFTCASIYSQSLFIPDAPFVGEINGSYIDPEFNDKIYRIVFQDYQNRLWIGNIDPITGFFISPSGKDFFIDSNLPLVVADKNRPTLKYATNGPEWTKDSIGHCVVYTRLDNNGLMQQYLGRVINDFVQTTQLTKETFDCYGNMPSRYEDGKPPRIAFTYDWPFLNAKCAWISTDQPSILNKIDAFDPFQMSMWSPVSPEFLFIHRTANSKIGQVASMDANTGKVKILTNDSGDKDDPGFFRAPEFDNDICLLANIDNQYLAVYRDLNASDGFQTRVAVIALPQNIPYRFISSPEIIAPVTGVNGASYFTFLARAGSYRSSAGGIFIAGLGKDNENRLIRRIDDGALNDEAAVRMEPEPFIGKNEIYIYYNFYDFSDGTQGLRRAATGIRIDNTTSITDEQKMPTSYRLLQNFPNPFNPRTVISYQISAFSHVSLKVYDVLGREVATLVDEFKQPGNHSTLFSPGSAGQALNSTLSSGVYFYQLNAGNYVETKKMMVINKAKILLNRP